MSYLRLPHYTHDFKGLNTVSPVSEVRSTSHQEAIPQQAAPHYHFQAENRFWGPTKMNTNSLLYASKSLSVKSALPLPLPPPYYPNIIHQTLDSKFAQQKFSEGIMDAPHLHSIERFETPLPIPASVPASPVSSPAPALLPPPATTTGDADVPVQAPATATAPAPEPIPSTMTASRRSTRVVARPHHLVDYVEVATTTNNATSSRLIALRISAAQRRASAATSAAKRTRQGGNRR